MTCWKENKDIVAENAQKGNVFVMPADTIYGVWARAFDVGAVERIYELKGRSLAKPFIVLIGTYEELDRFGIVLTDADKQKLLSVWPGPVSVVFQISEVRKGDCVHLHRGTGTIALRIPAPGDLREILKETGPLVSTSANLSKCSSAQNITEAKEYFGDNVDLYIEGETGSDQSSRLVRLEDL